MQVEIIFAGKKFMLDIPDDIKRENKTNEPEPSANKTSWTLLTLKQEIEKLTEIPAENQKIIFKGKSWSEETHTLKDMNLKAGDKLLVLGQKKKGEPEFDPVISAFSNIEKTAIHSLSQKSSQISEAIENSEKGFLPGAHKNDELRSLEKKLRCMHEEAMRTIELLDSMDLGESPSEMHRSRRKQLVVEVQKHLGTHDKLEERLRHLQDNTKNKK